jgi:hypothetical protein
MLQVCLNGSREVTVGVTTGAWTTPYPVPKIRMWTVLPDHASVNWHEDAAEHTAQALLDRGIAVHAGIWTGTDGAARFKNSPQRGRVQRILAEVMSPEPAAVDEFLAALNGFGPILLHGEGRRSMDGTGRGAPARTRRAHRARGHPCPARRLPSNGQRRSDPRGSRVQTSDLTVATNTFQQ